MSNERLKRYPEVIQRPSVTAARHLYNSHCRACGAVLGAIALQRGLGKRKTKSIIVTAETGDGGMMSPLQRLNCTVHAEGNRHEGHSGASPQMRDPFSLRT